MICWLELIHMGNTIKRLSIPLAEAQHKAIKLSASLQGQTIKEYILARLFQQEKNINNETLVAMREMEHGKNLTIYDDVNDFLNEVRTINGKHQTKSRQQDEKRPGTDGEKRKKPRKV